MDERRKAVLCWNCQKLVDYTVKTRKTSREINGKVYYYNEKYAICPECHEEILVPNMDDINEKTIENLYRKSNGIITVEEINQILERYHIEKRPLSKLLGFGEITITRYLDGQLPSKKYSDILLKVLYEHKEMKKYLETSKENITKVAYEKVYTAIQSIEDLTEYSSKIEAAALYIINSPIEITNLSLQKILYYIKGFGMTLLNNNIFSENCEAWVHGPVFPVIYEKYRIFDRQVIQDCNCQINYNQIFNGEEIKLMDYVLNCIGIYNGSILREFTHREEPWIQSREGFSDDERCTNIIPETCIKSYFDKVNEKFKIETVEGVRAYLYSLNVLTR